MPRRPQVEDVVQELLASDGATPAIGSSSRIMRGSTISARPNSSSLRWPPESVPA